MKKLLLFSFFLLFIFFVLGCSSEKKSKEIIGKWKTINNENNTQIKLSINDSTILSEFWFDEGIKKVQYKYEVVNEEDSIIVIKTINYFKIETYDTILLQLPLITFITQDGSRFILRKIE